MLKKLSKVLKIISQKVLKQSLPNFTPHWTLVVPMLWIMR